MEINFLGKITTQINTLAKEIIKHKGNQHNSLIVGKCEYIIWLIMSMLVVYKLGFLDYFQQL